MFNESIVSDIVCIVYKLTQYYIFVKRNLRLVYIKLTNIYFGIANVIFV